MGAMKLLVCGAALMLITCISLSESACYIFPHEKEKKLNGLFSSKVFVNGSDCVDPQDNSEHLLGSTWINRKCQTCSCVQNKTFCCDRILLPRGYSPDCVATFDKNKCQYIVHQRDNLTAHCKVRYYVGK